jgi:hypothetical protein
MSTGIYSINDRNLRIETIVCRVFFSADELFRVEELSVRTSPDFIENGRFKIHVNGSRNVLSIS